MGWMYVFGDSILLLPFAEPDLVGWEAEGYAVLVAD